MRELILNGRYALRYHAKKVSLPDDFFNESDAIHGILNEEIVEEQWDEEYEIEKYLIYGYASDARAVAVVAHLDVDDNGKLVAVITVWKMTYDDESTED